MEARAAVTARDRGACQHPDCRQPGVDVHHVIPRSVCGQARRWDPNNLALLCRACHQWVTDNPADAATVGLHGRSWDRVVAGRAV